MKKAALKLNPILSTLLELLFPGRCLLCGDNLIFNSDSFSPLCRSCLKKIKPINSRRRCRVCSAGLISEAELCTRCRNRNYAFTSNYSIFEYRGVIKELIYQYKFRNRKRVAPILARMLAEVFHKRHNNEPLIPVPARKYTLRKRGWDHVDLISRIMEREYNTRIFRLLKRTGGIPQKSLGFEARARNIRGSIALRKVGQLNMSSVVLLDDIFTTGATASECARVLRSAGICEVEVLTLSLD